MPNPGRNPILAVAVVLLAAGLAACGSSGGTTAKQTAPDSETTASHPPAASVGPPRNVAVAISGNRHHGIVTTEYTEDAAILVSSVLERGGSYRVAMFQGAGTTLGTVTIDRKASYDKRHREAEKEYGAFSLNIDHVLGQMPPNTESTKLLDSLPEGNAVGAALREAVGAVHGKPGESWAVIASDGFDDTNGELPLPNVKQTARILRQAVGNADAKGVGIAMVGVGLTHKQTKWGKDGPLTKAWAIVCHEIHARECQIHADPRLPPPLAGTAQPILEGV